METITEALTENKEETNGSAKDNNNNNINQHQHANSPVSIEKNTSSKSPEAATTNSMNEAHDSEDYENDIETMVRHNPTTVSSIASQLNSVISDLFGEEEESDNEKGTNENPINIEDCNDNQSTSTARTPVNQNKGGEYHYNDNDDENSWKDESTVLEEDNINTVNSDKTSKVNQSEAQKVTLPPFIRYQMMILLDQNQDDSLIAEETEEEKSPLERIRDFLISLVGQFKIYDKDTKIISWKNAGNFTYMNTDDFPTDIAEIAT